jgi:hypothetical protein
VGGWRGFVYHQTPCNPVGHGLEIAKCPVAPGATFCQLEEAVDCLDGCRGGVVLEVTQKAVPMFPASSPWDGANETFGLLGFLPSFLMALRYSPKPVFSPKHRHSPEAVEEPPQSKSLRRKRAAGSEESLRRERRRLWTAGVPPQLFDGAKVAHKNPSLRRTSVRPILAKEPFGHLSSDCQKFGIHTDGTPSRFKRLD